MTDRLSETIEIDIAEAFVCFLTREVEMVNDASLSFSFFFFFLSVKNDINSIARDT